MTDAASGQSYRACSVKRFRRTKDAVGVVRAAIVEMLKADHPMTVRQVFYQLVVRDVIEKTEKQYQGTVIRLLTEMRMDGTIPFAWIVDESRPRSVNRTYNNIADAARRTAKFYRRSALRECPDYIEIWSEKSALAAIIGDAADDYDVPVVVTKGMPSLTQLYGTASEIARAHRAGKQTHIYQFGDHDPTGVLIPRAIEQRIAEMCENLNCPPPTIERVALTREHIIEFNLPTRPTKRDNNAHAKYFEGDSVELDALPAAELRSMVREVIQRHISDQELDALRVAEESERELLEQWADDVGAA
jgi:DNA topoisomerase VI subunit A